MPGRENRRDQILVVAADQFMEKGYHATSIRHIAQLVGVTEAAIYYHFKEGKRELLKHVIELAEVDLRTALKFLETADSLNDLIMRYADSVMRIWRGRVHRTIRWVISELPHLTSDERSTFYRALLGFHEAMTRVVQRFVTNAAEAANVAWLLICTSFGYRQIFYDLEVESMVNVDVTSLFSLITEGLPST